MRRIGLALGTALAVPAAATLVAQLLSLLAHGAYLPLSLAAIWQVADPASLARLPERLAGVAGGYPWLLLDWLLRLPAWLVLGLLALPLLLAGRAPRRGWS